MSLFLLSWRKIFLLALFFIIALLLHYLVSFLRDTEEPSFFILALIIIPVYFMVAIIYSLIYILRQRREGKLETYV